jgi:hypothetical protein
MLFTVSLVDADFFFATAGTTTHKTVLFDADVVLSNAVRLRVLGVAGFVTFPSGARRGEADLTLYLDFVCFFCDSVGPVRGREDTEWNRNASVKVQGAWSRRRSFLITSRAVREQVKRMSRKNF